ncbi:FixH family protein [Oxalobacteraceae bacterium]|nr:FixH family protein [Oxalobacteraceae bacterium]
MRHCLVAAMLYCCCGAGWGGALQASLECRPAGAALVYDCLIRLADAGGRTPLAGAVFTVGADMPSMPMAHNVRPVQAQAQRTPGLYRARLALEMAGRWNVKLRIASPAADLLILPYDFAATR